MFSDGRAKKLIVVNKKVFDGACSHMYAHLLCDRDVMYIVSFMIQLYNALFTNLSHEPPKFA